MKHVMAIIIKYVMTAIILGIVLSWLTDLNFTEILYIAGAVTILAYIIGDLLILPATNNTIATIADAGLALLTIYMFNYLWNNYTWVISFTDALIAAAAVGVGEWFFHKYIATNVLPNRNRE